jgi:AraC-like DNA-binding protein
VRPSERRALKRLLRLYPALRGVEAAAQAMREIDSAVGLLGPQAAAVIDLLYLSPLRDHTLKRVSAVTGLSPRTLIRISNGALRALAAQLRPGWEADPLLWYCQIDKSGTSNMM